MAIERQELLEIIKRKRIDFATGGFLDIDYRIKSMPYGKKKVLMDNVYSIQASSKRIRHLQKELEAPNLSEVERERAQDEVAQIMARVQSLVPPIVDYLVGSEDGKQKPAIVKWDFLDNGVPIPITRDSFNELLDEETISFIGWQLLGDTSVGEVKGGGYSTQSGQPNTDTSIVPA